MNPEERRKEPRVAVAYQIMFECFLRGAKISEGAAHTVNLSEHGALIELSQEVDQNANMILWIMAPFYTLLVKGDVVHSRRGTNGLFQVGVKLTDIIEGNWDLLKKDVQEHLTEHVE